jgi:hypothetical protein
MKASEELRGLSRNGLREMAASELKARGARMDGGLLSSWARRLFRGRSLVEIQEIAFEICIPGRYGLDINDPQETHVLRALPGRTFSALRLMCIMYACFKRIEQGMDIGVDLGREWKVGGEGERGEEERGD